MDNVCGDVVFRLGATLFFDAGVAVGLDIGVTVGVTVGLALNNCVSAVSLGEAVAFLDGVAVAEPQPAIRKASNAIQVILCFKICLLVSR